MHVFEFWTVGLCVCLCVCLTENIYCVIKDDKDNNIYSHTPHPLPATKVASCFCVTDNGLSVLNFHIDIVSLHEIYIYTCTEPKRKSVLKTF